MLEPRYPGKEDVNDRLCDYTDKDDDDVHTRWSISIGVSLHLHTEVKRNADLAPSAHQFNNFEMTSKRKT